MKRLVVILLVLLLLTGCGKGEAAMEQALRLRGSLREKNCTFDAVVTADFGDVFYAFRLNCAFESTGEMSFTVLEPETISGITVKISAQGGELTFDNVALAFELLADGQISTVSGAWVMMQALVGGYITSAGVDGEYTRVTIQDTYDADALTVDLWLDGQNIPVQGDILWKDRRVLSVKVENFVMG